MDIDQLEVLLALLSKHEVTRFRYKDETHTISLGWGGSAVSVVPTVAAAAAPPVAAATTAPVDTAEDYHVVESPMVGTFYRAPNPGAPNFVEVGTQVGQGTTLCIVEAMKLMNEIESDVDGTIVKVLVDNAQAVQFGQPLFHIRTG